MSWLTTILDVAAGGGLTTAVGAVGGAIMTYKERKLEMEHELALIPHKERQLSASLKLHRMQLEVDEHKADQALFADMLSDEIDLQGKAIEADRTEYTATAAMDKMPWQVGAVRTLFRPFLTLCLWLAVVTILIVKPEPAPYVDVIVATVTNGAAASLGLWFGSRMMKERRPIVNELQL